MLYLVMNLEKQAPWQNSYETVYRSALANQGIVWREVDAHSLGQQSITENDFVWVMHFNDLKHPNVRNTCGKVMFRMSGTATHPYCYQVNFGDEKDALDNIIDINMSFHPRMTEYVKRFYPKANFVDTGYPVYVPSYQEIGINPNAPRANRIVVGGRLSPDKQFMLTAYMLEPYLKDYEVVFCFPNSRGKDTSWIDLYGGQQRYENLGFKFMQLDNLGWLKYLATSKFYFTASLGDTACRSCIEAVSLGCYPLVPKIGHGLPVYDTYINVGYEPFSQQSLSNLISKMPEVKVDKTWFDPDLWAVRFKEIIQCGI